MKVKSIFAGLLGVMLAGAAWGADVTFSTNYSVNIGIPDGRTTFPTLTLDSDTPSAFLTSFDGLDPNGDWTLFIADLSGGDTHTLVSWGLEVTGPVPEPGTTVLFALGGVGLLLLMRRKK